LLSELVARFFSDESPLKKALPHFAPRAGQHTLANKIVEAITNEQHLIAEAGTGTGKTFAYLIPALLAEKKVVISTGTKALQDQLFYKDLPLVKNSLKTPIKIALLKGRQNYICQHHLLANTDQLRFLNKETISAFQQIRTEHARTKFGETNEIKSIPEDNEIWRHVTSTRENCLGQECQFYQDCYVNKARKRALDADVVVVNHHLLLADYQLKEDGFGELLPETDLIIWDEAHQIPEIATRFYGQTISSRQILDLANDIDVEYLLNAKDMKQLSQAAHQVSKSIKDMRLALGNSGLRQAWATVAFDKSCQQAIEQVKTALTDLAAPLELAAGRSKNLESYWERLQELTIVFEKLTQQPDANTIHWFETFTHSFMIHQSPLIVKNAFQKTLEDLDATCVFTSATLTVNRSFQHYLEQLGLEKNITLQVDSPFDLLEQGLLYVPRGIPDPKSPDYINRIVDAAIPVINAAKGRTFFLFTSYYGLNQAAELLKTQIDYPLFIQGTKPKDQLLKDFVESGNGVLLATTSFWEGVDVRGQALSCVIIDKLPFSVPDDPIHKARSESLRQQGKQPFFTYSLPQAVIMLKQGVGRLIRDVDDKGVLMLCDPRIIGKDYGRIFLETLADYPRTRDLQKAMRFLEEID